MAIVASRKLSKATDDSRVIRSMISAMKRERRRSATLSRSTSASGVQLRPLSTGKAAAHAVEEVDGERKEADPAQDQEEGAKEV